MRYEALPSSAAWRHQGARDGHEVLVTDPTVRGPRLRGVTTAVEDGVGWSVGYELDVADDWSVRRAEVRSLTADGEARLVLERDAGGWSVDGVRRPDLAGLVDVDLESSAVTNTLPVHRLEPGRGTPTPAPALFVRATTLAVEVLEQTYTALDDTGLAFAYAAPRFGVACTLTYDRHGLVVDYPDLATRVR
ncbi:putative glycolipid-binding domain-containing protein [Nocardioides sp. CFH 31398]|uniref:putative glycolipid-binding domain-containing protein n=1 Tax=Nocardioides sp. CFH 31398 TaxID=2919579 RepID=UPI001F06C2C9|nr:putative glycolipid-binding domain-containing protein [Nocardioides sp. CFH 31398]MCH1865158.1 putative glycolipid-binding domain-containing protein [Nocardioides sp. CFH 31398]